VEERLAAVVRESEVVIEKLRARLDEMREGKATHLTLDEVFDLVKELNELWDITSGESLALQGGDGEKAFKNVRSYG
jgi:hypothetical protein